MNYKNKVEDEYSFNYILKHNKELIFNKPNKVVLMRSHSAIMFNKKYLKSYSKTYHFSEFLYSINDRDIPEIYKNVVFTTGHVNFSDDSKFDKFFWMEICFDHVFANCNPLPSGNETPLFWIIQSNSVMDNSQAIQA